MESASESESESEGESDDEAKSPRTRQAEREEREQERQRVLEAAGFVIKPAEGGSTVGRSRSVKLSRRPPPPTPIRRPASTDLEETDKPPPERDLPPVPENGVDEEVDQDAGSPSHLDDAFERYENFKQRDPRRMSVVSTTSTMDSMPAASSTTSASTIPSSSRTAYSRFHDLLSRKTTPVADDRPAPRITTASISGPIPSVSTPISRDHSPAFGSVSAIQ